MYPLLILLYVNINCVNLSLLKDNNLLIIYTKEVYTNNFNHKIFSK